MTEEKWLTSNDFRALLLSANRYSERKSRLLSVALCRIVWPFLTDNRVRDALELAEQFVEGQVWKKNLRAAHRGIRLLWEPFVEDHCSDIAFIQENRSNAVVAMVLEFLPRP